MGSGRDRIYAKIKKGGRSESMNSDVYEKYHNLILKPIKKNIQLMLCFVS